MAFSKLEGLYKSLESDADDETQNETPMNTSELAKLITNDTVHYDVTNENAIYDETYKLAKSLEFCEQIVTAAHELAQYVPDLSNDQHSEFWKQKLIPNLVESLTQNDRARIIIVDSFASIRNLSIIIQRAGEILKQTRGSAKAIEIAQQDIPNALEKLEQCRKDVSTLKDSAINTFASQTEEIFKIIGPKAADFFNQKLEIEIQLNGFYDKQQNLYRELAEKQEEVSRYSFLISATEKHRKGAKQELEETKRRTDELQKLNTEIEKKIQNLTAETITRHRSYFFGMISTSSKAKDIANLKAEKEYYDSIVLSRMERVREHQEDKAEEQKVMKELDVCLSEYKSKYEKAKREFDKLSEAFDKRMIYFQDQINILSNQLEEIDKKEINTQNITGLQGKTLISCLIAVRKFSHTITGGAAYAPLISILDGIKNMVQSDIKLLSSSDPYDIFIAGNRLLAQIQFFSRCSADLNRVLPPIQYKSITNAVE